MQEDQLVSVTLRLAGRSYRIKIKAEEEEHVRKAVKLADERLEALKTEYTSQDNQDYLAIALLLYATDQSMDALNNPVLKHELSAITARIDAALQDDN